jgi:hypothetical protein
MKNILNMRESSSVDIQWVTGNKIVVGLFKLGGPSVKSDCHIRFLKRLPGGEYLWFPLNCTNAQGSGVFPDLLSALSGGVYHAMVEFDNMPELIAWVKKHPEVDWGA